MCTKSLVISDGPVWVVGCGIYSVVELDVINGIRAGYPSECIKYETSTFHRM